MNSIQEYRKELSGMTEAQLIDEYTYQRKMANFLATQSTESDISSMASPHSGNLSDRFYNESQEVGNKAKAVYKLMQDKKIRICQRY